MQIVAMTEALLYKHEILTMGDAKQQVIGSMQKLCGEVTSGLLQFKGHLDLIKETEDHVIKYQEHLKAKVNKSYDIAIKNIETARQSLLSVIDDTYGQQSKKLWAERDMVERTILGQESCLAFSDRLLKSHDDAEVIYLSSQALRRLKQLKDSSWNPCSIDLTFLSFDERVPTGIGDIVQFHGQNCIRIDLPKGIKILPRREYNFLITVVDCKGMFDSPDITVSADIKIRPYNQTDPTAKSTVGNFDASRISWEGTLSCEKDGNYALVVTVVLFGKVLGTSNISFTVSDPRAPAEVLYHGYGRW